MSNGVFKVLAIWSIAALGMAAGVSAQTVWDGTANTSWYNSSQSSFTITTAEQLAGLAQLVNNGDKMNGKTITLGADIMLNDTTNWKNWATAAPARIWTPIGFFNNINFDNTFSGTFDGAGFVVSGVYINASTRYQGFFGVSEEGSNIIIKNLGIAASYVRGTNYIGGLIGANNGRKIENCYYKGTVVGTGGTGGTAGLSFVGGLVGESYGTITNSYATGSVSGVGDCVGGLVGINSRGRGGATIENCYAAVNVSGTNIAVGGLAGYCNDAIINSYATGTVTGKERVGGLAGYNIIGTITNSYATGAVTGTTDVGGLVGLNDRGTITSSYYDSQTSGRNDAGKGTSKTTAQMKQQGTYTGWDFRSVWHIAANKNGGYPHFAKSMDVTTVSSIDNQTFTGQSIEPKIEVKDGAAVLIENRDYELSYENNVNVGIAIITVSGKNNYHGEISAKFRISSAVIDVNWGETAFEYNGKPQGPTPNISDSRYGNYRVILRTSPKTNVGEYDAIAELTGADENETVNPNEISLKNPICSYTITQKPLTVRWSQNREFTYNKMVQVPRPVIEEPGVSWRLVNGYSEVGEYTDANGLAPFVLIISSNAGNYELKENSVDYEIKPKPLKVRLKDTPANDTVKIENGERFASVKEIEDYLSGLLEYDGFATDTVTNESDDENVLRGSPKVSIREIVKEDDAPRFARAESLMDLIRLYEIMIETENVKADNYTPQAQEGVILSISEFRGTTSIGNNVEKSDSRYGIRIKGDNIVSQKAEISVVVPIPNSDKTEIAREIKVVIYDNTGNAVFSGEERSGSGAKVTWDLRNKAGRNVANGSYLIVAEAKNLNRVYWYSAKIGVKR